MDRCLSAPPGWYCTREIGHEGPCAAWPIYPERKGTHRRLGFAAALVVTLLMWAAIVAGVLALVGKPEVKRDARTACERSNPPWLIAERCR